MFMPSFCEAASLNRKSPDGSFTSMKKNPSIGASFRFSGPQIRSGVFFKALIQKDSFDFRITFTESQSWHSERVKKEKNMLCGYIFCQNSSISKALIMSKNL
jgi:hypothetical protein